MLPQHNVELGILLGLTSVKKTIINKAKRAQIVNYNYTIETGIRSVIINNNDKKSKFIYSSKKVMSQYFFQLNYEGKSESKVPYFIATK
jgi:hypothetical protein